jgi:hypothetical protein
MQPLAFAKNTTRRPKRSSCLRLRLLLMLLMLLILLMLLMLLTVLPQA